MKMIQTKGKTEEGKTEEGKTEHLTTSLRSDIIAPNVIDMTGPINGDTSIAAVIFGALFSMRPRAANELE